MDDKSRNLSEPGVLAYQRVDPLDNPQELTWHREGDSLTIRIPDSVPVRRIVVLSVALVLSIGVGFGCWLFSKAVSGDVESLFYIPDVLIVWALWRLIYVLLYGATPTIIRAWPGGVEVSGPGERRPVTLTFLRERIVDLNVYSINTAVGPLTFLQITLSDEPVYTRQLPKGSESSVPKMREAIRAILNLR